MDHRYHIITMERHKRQQPHQQHIDDWHGWYVLHKNGTCTVDTRETHVDSTRIIVILCVFLLKVVAKSTLVNTCHTSLLPPSRTDVVMMAYSHASQGHISTDLRKYLLPSTNVTLWDAWGWTSSNYTAGQFSFMLVTNPRSLR